MVDSPLFLKGNLGGWYRNPLPKVLSVITLAGLFYLITATSIDRDLLAMIAVWPILLISLKDHRYLIIGWFLVAPYFQFGERGQPNLALNITHNLLVPFLTLIALGSRLLRREEISWGKEDLLFLVFLFYALFSAYYTSGGTYEDLKAIYSNYLLPFLIYTAIKHLRMDVHFVTALVYACLFHVAVLSLTGYFEFRTGRSLYTGVLYWTDVGTGRIAGPFGTPIIFGVCVSFVALFLYLGYQLQLLSRAVFGVAALLSTALFVLTFTRSVWLGAVTSTAYLILKGPGKRTSRALALIGFAAVLVVLGTYMILNPATGERVLNTETGSARIGLVYGSLKLIAQHPILGSGFGSFDELLPKHLPNSLLGIRLWVGTSHVTLLTLLAELGTAGTLCLLAFIFTALSVSGNQHSLPCDKALLVRVNYAFILAFAVNAFLIDMRFFPLAYCWFFMSLGIVRNAALSGSSGLK